MRERQRDGHLSPGVQPASERRPSAQLPRLIALQRRVGNRAVGELLGVQRHALNIDELTDESIEEDLPVQKVALATPAEVPAAEHDRLLQKGADITQQAQGAYNELAAARGSDNKTLRHVAKAFQRGLLLAPSPIVEVWENQLSAERRRERIAQGNDFRWFWWSMPEGEDYRIEHRNWGGGFLNRAGAGAVTIGVRDVLGRDTAKLKRALVHEAVHQMQFERDVNQGDTMEAKYRKEFEAYWMSGEFGDVRGERRRAERIRTHIVGTSATDRNTVYTEIRDWYHTPANAAERAVIDAIRIGNVGGLAWWQLNVHIKRLLQQLDGNDVTDDQRLVEWNKLGYREKGRALADPVLGPRLKGMPTTVGSAFARAVGSPIA